MSTKFNILSALIAAMVFGYMGLFHGSNVQAGGQTFDATPGSITEIDVVQCYDTVIANSPVQAPPVGGALTGRVTCNTANPAMLPVGAALSNWSVINVPLGNRLTQSTTFTPSGAGQWSYSAVSCTVGAFNECTNVTDTGDFTSRTDIGCNPPSFDVLGTPGGTGGAMNSVVLNDGVGWGNEPNEAETKWLMSNLRRLAQSVALGGGGPIVGGDNAYIHQASPFPTSWDFRTSDLANVNAVYFGGLFSITISAAKLNLISYTNPANGLVGSAATLGGSDRPPTDSVDGCLQSPQDTISEFTTLITPAVATRLPRWTTLQSDFDRADATGPNFEDGDYNRILDWQCDVVGVPADGDNDGDCDPDATDSNDTNRDTDGDLVPDGVELAYGSNPAAGNADTDGDGCDDYCELFQLTDPNDTDTDDDGQADKPDYTPTNCVAGGPALCGGDDAPSTGSDALDLTDDNCPTEANPSQVNTDSMYQFHGMGAGTGDSSNPDEDIAGDACDKDADNDGILGATEAVMKIQPWGGYSGAAGTTSVCVGPTVAGAHLPDVAMSDTLGDVDQDYVLDGAECMFRSRPDVSVRLSVDSAGKTIQNCSGGTTSPQPGGVLDGGCAQPGVGAHSAGSDADSDGLYMPGATAGGMHLPVERYFRTMCFAQSNGTCINDVDADDDGGPCGGGAGLLNGNGDGDSDSDRDVIGLTCKSANLRDGLEVRVYGTFPADTDTDQDGCPDGDEVNDITGDGPVNSADQATLATKFPLSPLDNTWDGMIDDYGTGANADINKDGVISSGDQALMALAIVAPGACTSAANEDNIDVGSITKGLP